MFLQQWGPSGCFIPQWTGSVPLSVYEWVEIPNHPESMALKLNGVQIGALRVADGAYYGVNNGQYTTAGTPPIAPPVRQTPVEKSSTPDDWRTGGVDTARIAKSTRYTCKGVDCTAEEAYQYMGDVTKRNLEDDSKRGFVTAIGKPEDVKRVQDDWDKHPALAALRDQVHFQTYTPDDPMIKGVGFKNDGTPTIYVQNAMGRVLEREDTYKGPEALAESARKARADYDPANDPNGGGGLDINQLIELLKNQPQSTWIIAALVGGGILVLPKKQTPNVK